MDSTNNCFDLHKFGLLAIDVDDRSGDAVITVERSRDQKRFPLMRLPQELRLHIISFFFPDAEEIDPGNERDCTQESGSGIETSLWTSYRLDKNRCQMAITRASRHIYEETTQYLYERLMIIAYIRSDEVQLLQTH